MSNTEPTSGNLFGTPVDFLPLPTPWPSLAGCAEGIYRQLNDGTILAWDPVYTRFEPGADACFPPSQRSWWDQAADADPSTALGPTFVCPEAYAAVHTTVLESNSASQAHYTYCCPKKYTLGAILPQDQRSVIQCSSIAGAGATIPYVSVTFAVETETVTGDDGSATLQRSSRITHVPARTVVADDDDPATVYAPPINGYNIVRRQASSSSSSESATSGVSSTALPSGTGDVPEGGSGDSSGLAAGAIAGIVVGAVLGLALLALGVFFVWRRSRRPPVAVAPSGADMYHEQPKGYYGAPPSYAPVMSEMPVDSGAQEMESPSYGYGHSPQRYELPSAR